MENEQKPKRVLVAVPTLGIDANPTRFLASLLTVINDIRRLGLTHAALFPYRKLWWEANNTIWNVAFSQNFDYILRMDDDVWGVEPGMVIKLFAEDKDVIGARYPMRHFPYSNCCFNRMDPVKSIVESAKERYDNPAALEEVIGTGVLSVDFIGFGMTLIKTEPFRMLDRPIYQGQEVCPDDSYFAQLCIENKIQQYVHTEVNLCHRDVTPINRMFLFNADARALLRSGQIQPGNKWYDLLIEIFGQDGMKDPLTLKGMEASPIITLR